jgi:hypothetical protein
MIIIIFKVLVNKLFFFKIFKIHYSFLVLYPTLLSTSFIIGEYGVLILFKTFRMD